MSELTWHEAFEVMRVGEECESDGGFGAWHRMRLSVDRRQVEWFNNGWRVSRATLPQLMGMKWRRGPKTPRVHKLPAKWRSTVAETGGIQLRACAADLVAALEADELVSIKGVTAHELYGVWRTSPDANYATSFEAVLDYLRKRGTP